MRSFHRTIGYLAGLSLVLAACGGDDNGGGGPNTNDTPVAAFNQTERRKGKTIIRVRP